jgi:hypothetical protein
MKILFR